VGPFSSDPGASLKPFVPSRGVPAVIAGPRRSELPEKDFDEGLWRPRPRLRAERRAGGLLAAVIPHQGGRPEKNGNAPVTVFGMPVPAWRRVSGAAPAATPSVNNRKSALVEGGFGQRN